MKKIFFLLIIIPFFSYSQIQIAPNKYAVYFKDKKGTPYSIDHPEQFLSQKAIERRKRNNVPITEQDLPVNPQYVKAIRDLGFKVLEVSKWLNCVVIEAEDTSNFFKIRQLPFVSNKRYTQGEKNYTGITIYKLNMPEDYKPKKKNKSADVCKIKGDFYGFANTQITINNTDKIHKLGFQGQGITMAILDDGFENVHILSVFQKAWQEKRILGWYDFVDQDSIVFDKGNHGTYVLSTILSCSPKDLVGTAPKVSVYLFRTEDKDTEYPIEEYNYVCACEKADSLGVDIIHSSLGYSEFDDEKYNYTYEQINGNYAISTIGADIAASKGIVVTTSAGNEGDTKWYYITAPADGDSVIAVGAIQPSLTITDFSSRGPTYDGRIKPDVCALGYKAKGRTIYDFNNTIYGTSFSGPIVAGNIACLMSAFPQTPAYIITDVVKCAGSISNKPDNTYGYGILDIYKAFKILNYIYYNLDTITDYQKVIIKINEYQELKKAVDNKDLQAIKNFTKAFPTSKFKSKAKLYLENKIFLTPIQTIKSDFSIAVATENHLFLSNGKILKIFEWKDTLYQLQKEIKFENIRFLRISPKKNFLIIGLDKSIKILQISTLEMLNLEITSKDTIFDATFNHTEKKFAYTTKTGINIANFNKNKKTLKFKTLQIKDGQPNYITFDNKNFLYVFNRKSFYIFDKDKKIKAFRKNYNNFKIKISNEENAVALAEKRDKKYLIKIRFSEGKMTVVNILIKKPLYSFNITSEGKTLGLIEDKYLNLYVIKGNFKKVYESLETYKNAQILAITPEKLILKKDKKIKIFEIEKIAD